MSKRIKSDESWMAIRPCSWSACVTSEANSTCAEKSPLLTVCTSAGAASVVEAYCEAPLGMAMTASVPLSESVAVPAGLRKLQGGLLLVPVLKLYETIPALDAAALPTPTVPTTTDVKKAKAGRARHHLGWKNFLLRGVF